MKQLSNIMFKRKFFRSGWTITKLDADPCAINTSSRATSEIASITNRSLRLDASSEQPTRDDSLSVCQDDNSDHNSRRRNADKRHVPYVMDLREELTALARFPGRNYRA